MFWFIQKTECHIKTQSSDSINSSTPLYDCGLCSIFSFRESIFVSSVYSLNTICLKCASSYLKQQCEFYLYIFLFLLFYRTIFEVRTCKAMYNMFVFVCVCDKICNFIVSTIYLYLLIFRRDVCKKCTPYCKRTLLLLFSVVSWDPHIFFRKAAF